MFDSNKISDNSVFTDKNKQPSEQDLKAALGRVYNYWLSVTKYAYENAPYSSEEWNFSKLGWNCRIKGKKSVVIYLMPQDGQFKASFVFGAAALEMAMSTNISESIKEIISEAKGYTEGRGFRINVKTKKASADVQKLIAIKLES